MLSLIDASGRLFIAHIQPKLSWACVLKLNSSKVWTYYSYHVYGVFVLNLSSITATDFVQ